MREQRMFEIFTRISDFLVFGLFQFLLLMGPAIHFFIDVIWD